VPFCYSSFAHGLPHVRVARSESCSLSNPFPPSRLLARADGRGAARHERRRCFSCSALCKKDGIPLSFAGEDEAPRHKRWYITGTGLHACRVEIDRRLARCGRKCRGTIKVARRCPPTIFIFVKLAGAKAEMLLCPLVDFEHARTILMKAYLFRSAESDSYAVTIEADGENLPGNPGDGEWNPIGPINLDKCGSLSSQSRGSARGAAGGRVFPMGRRNRRRATDLGRRNLKLAPQQMKTPRPGVAHGDSEIEDVLSGDIHRSVCGDSRSDNRVDNSCLSALQGTRGMCRDTAGELNP
jgi:hypothetical protein